MERQRAGDTIQGTVTGGVRDGQVAIGKGINQTSVRGDPAGLTDVELTQLRREIADLRARVAAEAPPELADSALERVDELEAAIEKDSPDLTTMEYVRNWFAGKLPGLAGTVTSVVFSPIVGKLVESAGEAVAVEFRRRFGR
jgi:hypothetical protein